MISVVKAEPNLANSKTDRRPRRYGPRKVITRALCVRVFYVVYAVIAVGRRARRRRRVFSTVNKVNIESKHVGAIIVNRNPKE